MPDFLRGMLSARRMRDPGLDMMRAAAGEDYRQQLKQRRAGRELPGFLQGDPAAELNLAALGIGPGPETKRQRERYGEALRRTEASDQTAAEKAEWQKRFAIEGRDMAKTQTEKTEAARATRFEEEMGFRKEAEKKSDIRRRASAEQVAFEKLEARKERADDKAFRRKESAQTAEYRAQSAARAAESHKITMREAERGETSRLNEEAIKSKQGNAVKQRIFDYAANVFGELPPADTPEGAMATAKFVTVHTKVFKDYIAFGGDSDKLSDRLNAYDRALDDNFPEKRLEDAMAPQVDKMTLMAIAQAELPEKIEAFQKQRRAEEAKKKQKKTRPSKPTTTSDISSILGPEAAVRTRQSTADFLGETVTEGGESFRGGLDRFRRLIEEFQGAGARNRPFGIGE